MIRENEEEATTMSVIPSDRIRGNGHQLKHRRYYLNVQKQFFTVKMIEHRNRISRDAVQSPFVDAIRT